MEKATPSLPPTQMKGETRITELPILSRLRTFAAAAVAAAGIARRLHAVAAVLPAAVGHRARRRRGGPVHRELAQRERVDRTDRVHRLQDHQLGTQVGE